MTETTKGTPATLLDEIAAAHAACKAWESATFNLGSAFNHCAKLKSFAGPALLVALESGEVRIEMPSEYHAPRFVVNGGAK